MPENVYKLHKLFKSETELAPLYEEGRGKYKLLKEALIEDIEAFIAPMREKYLSLLNDPSLIAHVLKEGKERAREVTEEKMHRVRKAIGVA